MSPDRRNEIPDGYILKECFPVGAKFYMPQTWFFRSEGELGTYGYFMTRERITGQSQTLGEGGIMLRTTTPEGFFTTGLSVNVINGAEQKLGIRATEMAQGFLRRPPQVVIPTGPVIEKREGELIIARRFCKTPVLSTSGRSFPPKILYMELTGNARTDTLYIISFETPSDKWNEDREVALTMVERRILDERI